MDIVLPDQDTIDSLVGTSTQFTGVLAADGMPISREKEPGERAIYVRSEPKIGDDLLVFENEFIDFAEPAPEKRNGKKSFIERHPLISRTLINVLTALNIFGGGVSYACTGAKQIGMGGAGITIADNAHATYWNQSLLGQLKKPTFSLTKLFGDADTYRYDTTVALGIPVIPGKFGIGLHYTNSEVNKKVNLHARTKDGQTIVLKDYANFQEKMEWVKLGFGIQAFNYNGWEFSFGGAVTDKRIENTWEWDQTVNGKPTGQIVTERKQEDVLDYEISALVQSSDLLIDNDRLRLGFLLRRWKYINDSSTNLRPGISYKMPNRFGDLTLAVSYYNVLDAISKLSGNTDNTDHEGARAGIEQTWRNFAFRAGYDNGGSRDTPTAGVGYRHGNMRIDFAYGHPEDVLVGVTLEF